MEDMLAFWNDPSLILFQVDTAYRTFALFKNFLSDLFKHFLSDLKVLAFSNFQNLSQLIDGHSGCMFINLFFVFIFFMGLFLVGLEPLRTTEFGPDFTEIVITLRT